MKMDEMLFGPFAGAMMLPYGHRSPSKRLMNQLLKANETSARPIYEMCKNVNFELFVLIRKTNEFSEGAEKLFELNSTEEDDSIVSQCKSIRADFRTEGKGIKSQVARDEWKHLGILAEKLLQSQGAPLSEKMRTRFWIAKEAWEIRAHAIRWQTYLKQFGEWLQKIVEVNSKRAAEKATTKTPVLPDKSVQSISSVQVLKFLEEEFSGIKGELATLNTSLNANTVATNSAKDAATDAALQSVKTREVVEDKMREEIYYPHLWETLQEVKAAEERGECYTVAHLAEILEKARAKGRRLGKIDEKKLRRIRNAWQREGWKNAKELEAGWKAKKRREKE